jgi:tetratricopeptide (TPR) repeat protein
MDIPQNLSPELINEYNKCYEKGFGLLEKYAKIQGSKRKQIGSSDKNQIEEVISHLSRCIEIVPNAWSAMWGIGKAYQVLDSHDTSLYWFEETLKIEKTNPDVYREATLEALKLGNAEKAINYSETAVNLAPHNAGLLANYALALLLNRRGDDALTTIKKACKLDPKDTVNKNVLSYIEQVVNGHKGYPDTIE